MYNHKSEAGKASPPTDAAASDPDARRRAARYERLATCFASQGPLVGGTALWKALGYRSGEAFRQARHRASVPIQTFEIAGRRGAFAYKHELIDYLADLGESLGATARSTHFGRQP